MSLRDIYNIDITNNGISYVQYMKLLKNSNESKEDSDLRKIIYDEENMLFLFTQKALSSMDDKNLKNLYDKLQKNLMKTKKEIESMIKIQQSLEKSTKLLDDLINSNSVILQISLKTNKNNKISFHDLKYECLIIDDETNENNIISTFNINTFDIKNKIKFYNNTKRSLVLQINYDSGVTSNCHIDFDMTNVDKTTNIVVGHYYISR